MTDVPKGRFTFRFAAVCFALSAVWELLTLGTDAVPFGRNISGTGAAIYHLVYGALFAWVAFGLWKGSRSGFYVLLATTVLYTADLLVLLAGDTLATLMREQFAGNEDLFQLVSLEYMLQVMTLMTVVLVLGWWGFVGYAYYRREYFGLRPKPGANNSAK